MSATDLTLQQAAAQSFTPGPWSPNIHRLSDGSIWPCHVVDADGIEVAQLACGALRNGQRDDNDAIVANARAIAAVPDLVFVVNEITQDEEIFHIAVNGMAVHPDRAKIIIGRLYELARVAREKAGVR